MSPPVNTRPCRHCRSAKHWDYECEYSRKGEWQARANYASISDPNVEALNAYNNLYYELESGDELENDLQDFHEPLQSSDWYLQIKSEDESRLEGNQEKVTVSIGLHEGISLGIFPRFITLYLEWRNLKLL